MSLVTTSAAGVTSIGLGVPAAGVMVMGVHLAGAQRFRPEARATSRNVDVSIQSLTAGGWHYGIMQPITAAGGLNQAKIAIAAFHVLTVFLDVSDALMHAALQQAPAHQQRALPHTFQRPTISTC